MIIVGVYEYHTCIKRIVANTEDIAKDIKEYLQDLGYEISLIYSKKGDL